MRTSLMRPLLCALTMVFLSLDDAWYQIRSDDQHRRWIRCRGDERTARLATTIFQPPRLLELSFLAPQWARFTKLL